jgi:hypothetical protein
MRERKLVLIDWVDSCSSVGGGWVFLDELEAGAKKCRSIGWIIAEDEESITVSGHLGNDPDQCLGDMTIPRCAIAKITPMKEPTKS